jgi:hypothetical protein
VASTCFGPPPGRLPALTVRAHFSVGFVSFSLSRGLCNRRPFHFGRAASQSHSPLPLRHPPEVFRQHTLPSTIISFTVLFLLQGSLCSGGLPGVTRAGWVFSDPPLAGLLSLALARTGRVGLGVWDSGWARSLGLGLGWLALGGTGQSPGRP